MQGFAFLSTAIVASIFSVSTVGSAFADRKEAERLLAEMHKSDVLASDTDSDGADRIRYADRLTMLTQRVAAASCALTSDVAVEESHHHLEKAMYETDIILDALRDGNEALHIIGPEKRKRTLHDIEELAQEWHETHAAVEAVLRDGHDVDNAHIIDDHNLSLLEKAEVLASDISGQYSNPYEITQAHAMLITIAGRQRMLTQKMAKDACEIWTGYHAEDGRADLVETMAIYENSILALRDGMPAAGIIAAPNETIRNDLDGILNRWFVIKGNLEALLAGQELNMDQKYEIFHDLNVELDDLEHLIHDYKVYVEELHT
jgi:hypothetical protein